MSSSTPPNTRNDDNGAEFSSDFGFTFRVKASSGASACPCSRCLVCLAGKWRFQDQAEPHFLFTLCLPAFSQFAFRGCCS